MSTRAKGYLEDAPSATDLRAAHLMGAAHPRAGGKIQAASMLALRGARLEQGGASSCVSFAKTRTHQLSLRAQGGVDNVLISPLFDYVNARLQEHAGEDPETIPPLADGGSYPRLSMQATQNLGTVLWDACPYLDTAVNAPLGDEVYERAFDQKGYAFYRIDDVGPARMHLAAEAIRRGFAVMFGMRVDQAFEDHTGSDPLATYDAAEDKGGHMLALLEVEDGEEVGLFDNWWGPDWGFQDGMARMTTGLFGSPAITDVYALRAVPFR